MPESSISINHIPTIEAENSTMTRRSYHTPIEPIFFTPTYCGHYICKKEFLIDRALKGSYLILATTAGAGTLEYEGGSYALKPGCVMLLNCEMHHRYSAVTDGWEFLYTHFTGGMSHEYVNYLFPALPVIELPARLFVDVTEKLGQILELCDKPSAGSDEAILSGLLYSVLIDLISGANRLGSPDDPLTLAVTDAAAYINSHLSEKLDVTALAKRAYLSRPYFSSGFKRVLGVSPHDYIVLRRLNRAKRLLVETSMPVTAVAAEVGVDASSFSRLFSKNVGMTPLEYRRLMK